MISHTVRRYAFRATTVLAAAAPALVVASPALAAGGGWRGTGLTFLQLLGVLVGGPIVLFVVISLLFVQIPAWIGESRYRTGPGLLGAPRPVWFKGPADEQGSLDVAEPSQDGGGASASW